VIDQASISYAVSFSTMREMRKRRTPTRRAAPILAAFGSPTIENDVLERVQRTYTGLKLTDTDTTELDKLQTIYGPSRTHSYTTTRATKERVKAEANAATFLHLASPAILDQSVPMYSLVFMTPDTGDDGLLKLWEIASLNSKARVVVLPHTFTTSSSQAGDALIALSWAWLIAGTPAVVLNRWEGNSAEFIPEVYQLRQKMLRLRRGQTPSQWANYMFLGIN
jgi:CHAT domain-containing protein